MNDPELERQYFERGRQVLGKNAGGMLVKLLKAKKGCLEFARAAVEVAATKDSPTQWVGQIVKDAMPAGSIGNGYAESWNARARDQVAARPSDDRSKRPTLEQLKAKYGPGWGLGVVEEYHTHKVWTPPTDDELRAAYPKRSESDERGTGQPDGRQAQAPAQEQPAQQSLGFPGFAAGD